MPHATSRLALLFAILALAACGGGGGDDSGSGNPGTPTPDILEGTFHYTALFGDYRSDAAVAQWGTVEANGLGRLTDGTAIENYDGTIGDEDALFDGTVPYGIDADREIWWGTGRGDYGPTSWARGTVSADGSTAVLASTDDGAFPGLTVITKRAPQGTFDVTSLDGTYHLGILYRNPAKQDGALWGKVTFNGDGTGSSRIMVNFIGQVDGPFDYLDEYAVESDGTLSWDWNQGTGTFQGGIHAGGDLIVLAGKATADGAPAIVIMIRESDDASDASFDGAYRTCTMHGLLSEPGRKRISGTGTGSADGEGTFTFSGGRINKDGAVSSWPSGFTFDYEIEEDGTLTASDGVDPCTGAVSPTGDFVVFTGGSDEGDDPQVWFLLR